MIYSYMSILSTNRYMVVVEDTASNRICGCGTLTIEPKFIHEAGLCGHIEDVVVHSGLR